MIPYFNISCDNTLITNKLCIHRLPMLNNNPRTSRYLNFTYIVACPPLNQQNQPFLKFLF